MKFTAILTGVALALGLGATAMAFDDPPRAGRGHGGLMRGADANGDGSITEAEARAAREQMFTRMDADSDGFLTDADREARRAQREQARAERRQAGANRPGGPNLDTDGDGRVSRAEFLAGDLGWFERADANHDNVVDAAEIQAQRAAMTERWRARRQQAE